MPSNGQPAAKNITTSIEIFYPPRRVPHLHPPVKPGVIHKKHIASAASECNKSKGMKKTASPLEIAGNALDIAAKALRATPTPPPGNSTTDAQQQPKGREFRWITNEINYRSANRSEKDILTYKEALIQAESVYWPNRYLLYDLYKDVELDGHLAGIREKLFDAILNKTLLYKKNDAPVVTMAVKLKERRFREMCREILLTKFWGITGIEFIPGDKFRWNEIERKHIKPKWRKITYDQYGNDGINYDDFWNLWVLGNEKDLGAYLICAYYVLLKRGSISNWADFIEMYGLPTTVMKYEAYDEQTKAELKKIIKEAGSALQIVIPKQADHEIHDSKNTSNGDVQNKFIHMANEEMSVYILGATETSTSSAKSGGHTQSQTHSKEQKERIKALMDYLTSYLNEPEFIEVLRNYGFPVVDGALFEFDKEIDIDYITAKSKVDQTMIQLGLPVAKKYLYDTYAIDKPEPGDELLVVPANTPEPDDSGDDDTEASELAAQVKPRRNNPPSGGTPSPARRVSHSKLRNLYTAFSDFFGQALH